MNKLYKNIYGFGPRPSDKDFFKITKTQYNPNPDQKINNYELVLNTPTIKAYLDAQLKTIVLSIRGTTDSRDILADTMIGFNRLKYSNRYIEDKNIISNLITQYPPNIYDYYATGHSLGVALMRQLQREFPFIKNTVGFNGAVQPYDLIDQKQNLNKSYYTEDDGLYKLGGRFLVNKTVIPSTEKVIKNPFNKITPTPVKTGVFVYNAAVGHKLENFESLLGGAISRMREKLNNLTVKEIKEAVKNELNGLIKGYTKMKKEDLIDAIYGIGQSEEANSEKRYNGGSCCMCHIKDIVRGGAIEERKIESLEDFKTTELRKIASIFNKFFKIKLTKLTRDEIIKELNKYIYLNESGSIFVNEDDLFFSLKPKDVLKEIESKKLQNKIKKEAKPKTRRNILQKEKIGVLKALLISLGGDPTYKLNGRVTQLPKRSVIDEILVFEKKKMKI